MQQKDDKKKKVIIIVLILIILLLLGLGTGILFYILKSNEKGKLARDELALGGLLPGKTQDEITKLLNDKIEEGDVGFGIAAEPIFEYNGKKGRLGIENVPTNIYSFQVDVVLKDTNEVIYESGLIDPGYYIEYVELKKKLQAGDYPATAMFTTYSLEESEEKIAEARIDIILHVTDNGFYK